MPNPFEHHETLTVGEILKAIKNADDDKPVNFDFCTLFPTELGSWRGSYDELAFAWSVDKWSRFQERPTVKQIRDVLQQAIEPNNTFEGYKGGSFQMTADTPVWVDNHGECTNTRIVGVVSDEFEVTLITQGDA